MLKMRARSWTIRDGFADVLRGLHIREEVDDFIETGGSWPMLLASAQEGARGGVRPNGAARPRRTPLEPEERLPDLDAANRKAQATQEPDAETAAARAEPGNGDGSAGPGDDIPGSAVSASAEPEGEPAAPEESFTLADAEGGFIEVTGAEALRAAFERLVFDQHLSPDQILGLWESNEPAREAIERLFGPEALEASAERLRSAQAGQEERFRDRGAPWPQGDGAKPERAISSPLDEAMPARTEPEDKPAEDRDSQPAGAKPRRNGAPDKGRAGRRGVKRAPAADPRLVVSIDPSWGDQKVFRYYRARLAALHTDGAARAAEIAQLRAANSAVEARLRRKLPHRMEEIDFLYGAGTGSGDVENGVPR